MDKDTRNAIERATQRARKLLEEDFAAQLEGDFDVHRDGAVGAKAGSHLSARQAIQRARIVAAIEHKREAGVIDADAARDYLRDAAFTTLNRFVALKMLEARDLVQECITKGEQSAGYREFCGMAPGLPLLPESAGYRLYIESLFDELSTEVKVLFDRRDTSSVLWPKRSTLGELLEILNATELAHVWGEDETIGWVYQFFNGQDERRLMRDESQAPRNSRELAVRNQFFTPRYVVQFLTDNTLGRIWYEMRETRTALAQSCEYMVRKPGETIAPRPKKDPRDLRVLDPACGSGHFLLYAFDLLLAIYEEAYTDPESPRSAATGKPLSEDYPSLDALRRAIPGLVLEHNLHGVDIDPRCAQIAQLALWMRAQKAHRKFGVGRGERVQIRRSNIVVAEPLVADGQIAKEFVGKLGDAELGRVFMDLVDSLGLAGDLGILLRLEQIVARQRKRGQTGELFALPEERIRAALDRFVREKMNTASTRHRLFADDAAHGVALLGIADRPFDVVLMNPPFGEATPRASEYIERNYRLARHDLGMVFVSRALSMLSSGGLAGCITSRAFIGNEKLKKWRHDALLGGTGVLLWLADLGIGVLDALVETCAYTFTVSDGDAGAAAAFLSVMNEREKGFALRERVKTAVTGAKVVELATFHALPDEVMCYWLPSSLLRVVAERPALTATGSLAVQGLATGDDFRFFRLRCEIGCDSVGRDRMWVPLAKGGEYAPYIDSLPLLMKWGDDGAEVKAYVTAQYPYLNGDWGWVVKNSAHYFKSGLTYPERTTSDFSPRVLPAGAVFSAVGQAIFLPNEALLWGYLGGAYTRIYKLVVDAFLGSGDSSVSGSAAKHIRSGLLNVLPHPLPAPSARSIEATRACVERRRRWLMENERSAEFGGVRVESATLAEYARSCVQRSLADAIAAIEASRGIEEEQGEAWMLAADDMEAIDRDYGLHPMSYPVRRLEADLLAQLARMDVGEVSDAGVKRHGARRQLTKKSFIADRHLELVAHLLEADPRAIAGSADYVAGRAVQVQREVALRFASLAFGVAIGRYREDVVRVCAGAQHQRLGDPLEPLPARAPAVRGGEALGAVSGILVDDPSHQMHLEGRVVAVWESWFGRQGAPWMSATGMELHGPDGSWREWYAKEFFAEHVSACSESRRKAPMYWQIATPSASYSVWLYIHAFSRDTLFRVQNDFVAPKRAHEERRLESLTSEQRDGASAAQRRQLAVQAAMVEELRALLEEVKRVAPLWNPNLDDGVIINFAPLWRLVPQNKTWQRELKATWDALCDGLYDWAHLAMHLWPERVVPKCAKDRSLAIAHGLEDVFWVGSGDGMWTAREAPTRSVDELVRERTSPAVKSALSSLLEAPAAAGSSSGRRGSGRRSSGLAAEGGVA